jgi:hypothetical protein
MLAARADVEEGTMTLPELDEVDRSYAPYFIAALLIIVAIVGASLC